MSDLDTRLKAFLDACESERELGHTNEAIQSTLQRVVDKQIEHEKNDVERFGKLDSRLDQHHWRIGSLEERATKAESKQEKLAEDTGNHRIIIAEKKADHWTSIALKIGLLVLAAAIGAIARHVAGR